MRERRGAVVVVVGTAGCAAAALAACAEVATGTADVVSVGFDTSSVAVVAGDTLRDTLGRVLPLRAAAFNAAGDTVTASAVAITYVVPPSDTGVVRTVGSLLLGVRPRDTTARVFAAAGTLQGLPKSVDVTRRPERLQLVAAARDSALYTPPSRSAVSGGGAQLLVTADSAGARPPVRRVVVRFALERAAPRIADSVAVVDERPLVRGTETFIPRSPLDTTDARGNAGRRVLIFLRSGATARDTVVLRATVAYPAAYPGAALARDTVRVVVPVVPQAARAP